MTLLVVSPDYASHLLPLATLASAWQEAGDDVVVATGPATAGIVGDFGFRRTELSLARGSNPGVIRVRDQPPGEDESLRGFFEATRLGMVETLTYQARARTVDLLWDPVAVGRRVLAVVEAEKPTQIIVDHLAFSARIALAAAEIPYGDVVLGHPTALPVGAEVYGYPTVWPRAFAPRVEDMAELRMVCNTVRDNFTEDWNAAAAALGATGPAVDDAFAVSGDLLLYNYPRQLHDGVRTTLLPPHQFLGSALRTELPDVEVSRWLDESEAPVVYVSFGSFLSARGDVLARVVDALRDLKVRVALASGSTDVKTLGDLPASWLVREFLPQVTILERSSLLITHAGNNSVTEAAYLGVPMVALPFSTDQFAGAAAIGAYGNGVALAPNSATSADIREAVGQAIGDAVVGRARALGSDLRRSPGPAAAFEAMGQLAPAV